MEAAPHRAPVRSAIAVLAVAVLLAGCSGNSAAPTDNAVTAPDQAVPALGGATLAQLRYGAAPKADDAVAYNPDVVILDGGADAVRSVSSNGLIWTIKGDAGHAQDLAVGKILFVTGRSAGRVLGVTPNGSDLDVVIGPVNLEDVIQKADFDISKPLDLGSMMFYAAPDLPGADLPGNAMDAPDDSTTSETVPSSDAPANTDNGGDTTTQTPGTDAPSAHATPTDPASTDATDPTDPSSTNPAASDNGPSDAPTTQAVATGQAMPLGHATQLADNTLRLPAVRLVATHRDDTPAGIVKGLLPLPTFGSSPTINLGGVGISPIAGTDGLGVGFDLNKDGIVLNGKAVLHLSAPKINFKMSIDHGVKSAAMSLDGAAGLTVSVNAGTDVPEGGNLNTEKRIEVPVDISIPLGGPVPLAVTIRQVLLFKTAFAARKSAYTATGDFTFGGSFGVTYSGGSLNVTGPTGFSGTKGLVSSINGASLGVNGLIIADQIRVVVGIGAFGFAAGPSFSFISRVGITRGSDLAAVPCSSGYVKIEMGAGLGYSIPQPVVNLINFVLKALNVRAINGTGGLEHFETIVNDGEPKSGPCKP